MLSVGIDFGTSNSSVAVFDGETTRLLEIDPSGRDARVMRSLVYIDKAGGISYGQRALDLYLEQNTGRVVQYELRRVGQVEMVFADVGTMVKDAYATIDVNEPGRLFQSLKRFLTATSFRATNVFGIDYRIDELLALLAREILSRTEAALGEPVTQLTVGWPVRFSQDRDEERIARTRLRQAWKLATKVEVRFVEEPVAAIEHFADRTELRRRENVLVFDFGGGTLDICVAKLEAGRAEALATRGVPIGGDLLDSRLVETRLAPIFGENAMYRSTGLPLPRHLFTRLQSWHTLTELNKPEYTELIHNAIYDCDQPEKLETLEALVTRNYGLAFFQAVEKAKVALSDALEADVRLLDDGIRIEQRVTRDEFESAVGPQIRAAQACAEEAMRAAKMAPEDIDLVITTGGSSLIPAFQVMLRATFPRAELEASEAFTSVAAGLALIGAR